MYLFETMLSVDGTIPLWDWHLRRLNHSRSVLGWPLTPVARPESPDGVVRLKVWADGQVEVGVRPVPRQAAPYRLGRCPWPVAASDPWLRHKSSHRAPYERARRWAASRGLDDALLMNEVGRITESTIANVVVEVGGKLLTPPLDDGLLPGVMRAVLLSRGEVEEAGLHASDVANADAVYLCNAVRGLFRVSLADPG